MHVYEEQELLSMMQEDIEEMLSSYGYYSDEQFIRIAMLAGKEEKDDTL